MVHASHQGFIELIQSLDHLGLENEKGEHGRKYTRAEIEDFVDGEMKDELLSICFELWSYGETGNISKLLNAPQGVTPPDLTASEIARLSGRAKLEARMVKHLPEKSEELKAINAQMDIALNTIESKLEERIDVLIKKKSKDKDN